MAALAVLLIIATFLVFSVSISIVTFLLLENARLWKEEGLATLAVYVIISALAGAIGGSMITVLIF